MECSDSGCLKYICFSVERQIKLIKKDSKDNHESFHILGETLKIFVKLEFALFFIFFTYRLLGS